MTQQGYVRYKDDWFGYPVKEGWQFVNNPVHEHTDRDGTVWSTVGVSKFTNRTQITMK